MTKKIAFIVGLCAFAATPVLATLTVTTTGGSGYGEWQTGSGGEFTLTPVGWNPLPLYAAVAKNQDGTKPNFQTFCIEEKEYVYPNTTFDVVFNSKAVMGGNPPSGDPLSQGAAWLYHEFQMGTLSGYDYQDTGSGRKNSAQDLQNAIWYLEGEGGSLTVGYVAKLNTQFGSVANAMFDNSTTGKYAVAVLNLYEQGHEGDLDYLRQDMLVCVPLPGSVLLAAFAVGLAGRKLRKLV
jgi:hypothetical protein